MGKHPGPSASSDDFPTAIWHDPALTYDGRFSLDMTEGLSQLPESLNSYLQEVHDAPETIPTQLESLSKRPPPALNIVMQVVGSQGDIQPFAALGQELQKYGHRVRVATHPEFTSFIEGCNLEHFDIGGNPAELMSYMVKNPGLLPKLDTVYGGELSRRRQAVRDMMHAFWRSCFEPPQKSGAAQLHGQKTQRDSEHYVADVIIANPPSFAHIHCAERLGIPLHLVFTMPWSPTQNFPHPLANIKSAKADARMANFLSFFLIDAMIWQGLGDVFNRFRYKALGLEPIDPTQAPGLMHRFKVPHTYCWSPSLVPKPAEWPPNISVPGFLFFRHGAEYHPPKALLDFLEAGPAPVYIGFGSVVVEDPRAMTELIHEAVRLAGVRAIVSQGWGGLGGRSGSRGSRASSANAAIIEPLAATDTNILQITACPHDYLFPRVSAVVHHGGAGTTAAGLAAGKPSIIVPFFGDQPFWGAMVHNYGAGPAPIPAKTLTAESLAAAIAAAVSSPDMSARARELAERIHAEDGLQGAVDSFHACLPAAMSPSTSNPLHAGRAPVWRHGPLSNRPETTITLSALAATVLRKEQLLKWDDLQLHRPCEYDVSHLGPHEPLSGGLYAVVDLLYEGFKGMGEILFEFVRVPYVGQRRVWARNRAAAREKGSVRAVEGAAESEGDGAWGLPMARVAEQEAREAAEYRAKLGVPGQGVLKGTLRITKAAARSPGAFTLAMARGAHNAPKLWGDGTVRPQGKITGLRSGVAEGVKELVFGTTDAFTGLITLPVFGMMEDGPVGLVTGAGKGLLGGPVKLFAAASGIVGYPLKGADVAITNALRGDADKAIRQARMVQGEAEWFRAAEGQKEGIVREWRAMVQEVELEKKGKGKGKGKGNMSGS